MPDVVGKMALVALIVSFILGAISTTSFENWLHPMQNGVPNVFQQDREYWDEVDQPIVAGNRLYLLFRYLGIVKVYDLQGNYQYTVNFTNERRKFGYGIYAKGNEMYYPNALDNSIVYYFKDDQFVKILTDGERCNISLDSSCKRNDDDDGNTYFLSGVNIMKQAPDGTQTVLIARPFLLNLFQTNGLLWAVRILAIVTLLVLQEYFY